MKVLDFTPHRNPDGKISPVGLVMGMIKHGISYPKMLEAQDIIQARLKKQLSGAFVLLRNLTLPNSDILVPMILVGPPGVYVIMPTNISGIYEARGAKWGVLEKNAFKPARINLLKRTANLTRAVEVYLQRQGYAIDQIEGVLMAANPGLQVDTSRPIVRVLMADAIDGFLRSLGSTRGGLSRHEVQSIVRLLQGKQPEPEPSDELDWEQFLAEGEEAPEQPAEEKTKPQPQAAAAARPQPKRPPAAEPKWPLGLTTKQFFLLLGMFIFEILIIFAMIIAVALTMS